MAERWQQWYPHHIDNWQGSANVQALSDLAYRAIHNLLQDMWKQADCSLPNDDRDLAKRSRVSSRWAECRDEVMDYLEIIDGRVSNSFLRKEWLVAEEKYLKKHKSPEEVTAAKREAGKRGAAAKWAKHGKPMAGAIPADGTAMANGMAKDGLTGTGTETVQVQKQKHSRDKREGDPRHEGFKVATMAYGAFKHVKLAWDGSEAKQLDLLLKSAPDLTLMEFQACLNHRARSPGTPHGDRPRLWLPNILRYQQGPLNTFNRTEEAHAKPEYAKNKSDRTLDALRASLAGDDQGRAGAAGDFAQGRVIEGGTGPLRGGTGELGDGRPPSRPEIVVAAT